jgi:hypothetical protein
MRSTLSVRLLLAAAAVVVWSHPARAQLYESVGIRAQGMGGAFVAVADDATATWWNPAGLASGALFNMVIERGQTEAPRDLRPTEPARREGATGFAIAFPALGLSYYSMRISEVSPVSPIATGAEGRQEEGVAGVALRSMSVRQFGVTVGQSIGERFVIGSTLKLVRAGSSFGVSEITADALDRADDLDVARDTTTDIDIGAMATFGKLRVGASMKHMWEPEVGDGLTEVVLARQLRAGAAYTAMAGLLVLAADVDTIKTPTVRGDVRNLAVGAETWMLRRRVGVRGGFTVNTVDDNDHTFSGGVSVAARQGVYVDGALRGGADDSWEGWSLGLRMTF